MSESNKPLNWAERNPVKTTAVGLGLLAAGVTGYDRLRTSDDVSLPPAQTARENPGTDTFPSEKGPTSHVERVAAPVAQPTEVTGNFISSTQSCVGSEEETKITIEPNANQPTITIPYKDSTGIVIKETIPLAGDDRGPVKAAAAFQYVDSQSVPAFPRFAVLKKDGTQVFYQDKPILDAIQPKVALWHKAHEQKLYFDKLIAKNSSVNSDSSKKPEAKTYQKLKQDYVNAVILSQKTRDLADKCVGYGDRVMNGTTTIEQEKETILNDLKQKQNEIQALRAISTTPNTILNNNEKLKAISQVRAHLTDALTANQKEIANNPGIIALHNLNAALQAGLNRLNQTDSVVKTLDALTDAAVIELYSGDDHKPAEIIGFTDKILALPGVAELVAEQGGTEAYINPRIQILQTYYNKAAAISGLVQAMTDQATFISYFDHNKPNSVSEELLKAAQSQTIAESIFIEPLVQSPEALLQLRATRDRLITDEGLHHSAVMKILEGSCAIAAAAAIPKSPANAIINTLGNAGITYTIESKTPEISAGRSGGH